LTELFDCRMMVPANCQSTYCEFMRQYIRCLAIAITVCYERGTTAD